MSEAFTNRHAFATRLRRTGLDRYRHRGHDRPDASTAWRWTCISRGFPRSEPGDRRLSRSSARSARRRRARRARPDPRGHRQARPQRLVDRAVPGRLRRRASQPHPAQLLAGRGDLLRRGVVPQPPCRRTALGDGRPDSRPSPRDDPEPPDPRARRHRHSPHPPPPLVAGSRAIRDPRDDPGAHPSRLRVPGFLLRATRCRPRRAADGADRSSPRCPNLPRGRGRKGVGRLRGLLAVDRGPVALTRSPLEDRFLQICSDFGIRYPEVNAPVLDFEVDCLWTPEGLIVELDGYGWHRSRESFESDRRRDVRLGVAGYHVQRFTDQRLHVERATVAAEVIALLDRLGRGRAASG